MIDLEMLKILASLGAGVTIGVIGMWFIWDIAKDTLSQLVHLVGSNTEAINDLRVLVAKLIERLNDE